jgi:hypothetical protein
LSTALWGQVGEAGGNGVQLCADRLHLVELLAR